MKKNNVLAAIKTLEDHTSDGLGVCGCWECEAASDKVKGIGYADIAAALSAGAAEKLDRARKDYEDVINT